MNQIRQGETVIARIVGGSSYGASRRRPRIVGIYAGRRDGLHLVRVRGKTFLAKSATRLNKNGGK